jgi:hypothetical protein
MRSALTGATVAFLASDAGANIHGATLSIV